jgi:hypothetical protein
VSGQTKWFVLAVCSLVAFALIALTAIDKYDEQKCEDHAGDRVSFRPPECNGFLPW